VHTWLVMMIMGTPSLHALAMPLHRLWTDTRERSQQQQQQHGPTIKWMRSAKRTAAAEE
jgi:hypothetical protein